MAAVAWLLRERATGSGRAEPEERHAASGALTANELREVAALALVLFPPVGAVPPELVAATARFWAGGRARYMRPPPPYRQGLAVLRSATADPFHALPPAAADALVAGLLTAPSADFVAIVQDLLEGLYTLLPGWHLVGYPTAPGYAAGPEAYTTRPGAA